MSGFSWISADKVAYSQDSIGSSFHDGTSIFSDDCEYTDAIVDVVRDGGRCLAVNNRTCYHQKEVHSKKSMKVRFCENDSKTLGKVLKRSKNCDGSSVKVRNSGS